MIENDVTQAIKMSDIQYGTERKLFKTYITMYFEIVYYMYFD